MKEKADEEERKKQEEEDKKRKEEEDGRFKNISLQILKICLKFCSSFLEYLN